MFMLLCMQVCVCVHMSVEVRGQPWVSFLGHYPLCWDIVSSWLGASDSAMWTPRNLLSLAPQGWDYIPPCPALCFLVVAGEWLQHPWKTSALRVTRQPCHQLCHLPALFLSLFEKSELWHWWLVSRQGSDRQYWSAQGFCLLALALVLFRWALKERKRPLGVTGQ